MRFDALPLIAEALEWVKQGVATGASDRNWKGYGARSRRCPPGFADWKRKLLTDPQTSGGLLVACAPKAVPTVLKAFRSDGFDGARVIGRLAAPARPQPARLPKQGCSACQTRSSDQRLRLLGRMDAVGLEQYSRLVGEILRA